MGLNNSAVTAQSMLVISRHHSKQIQLLQDEKAHEAMPSTGQRSVSNGLIAVKIGQAFRGWGHRRGGDVLWGG